MNSFLNFRIVRIFAHKERLQQMLSERIGWITNNKIKVRQFTHNFKKKTRLIAGRVMFTTRPANGYVHKAFLEVDERRCDHRVSAVTTNIVISEFITRPFKKIDMRSINRTDARSKSIPRARRSRLAWAVEKLTFWPWEAIIARGTRRTIRVRVGSDIPQIFATLV